MVRDKLPENYIENIERDFEIALVSHSFEWLFEDEVLFVIEMELNHRSLVRRTKSSQVLDRLVSLR